MNIGEAVEAIKLGKRASRDGWNGWGMWIAYSPGRDELPASHFWSPANQEFAEMQPSGCAVVLPSMTMKTARGEIQMGWAPSTADTLATDWRVLP